MKGVATLLLLIVAICGSASAQLSLTYTTLDEMSAEEVNGLPVEAVWPLMGPRDQPPLPLDGLNREVRLSLAILHYGIDLKNPTAPLGTEDTTTAIREFQRAIQASADGVLKVREYSLLYRYSRLERGPELVPGLGLVVTENERAGYAAATGTWVMDDIAFPLNYAEIYCSTLTDTCTVYTSNFVAPDFRERAFLGNDYQLMTSRDTFYIDRWSDGIVESRAGGPPLACRETRMTINSRTNTVYQTTQDVDPAGCPVLGSDERLPRLDTPRVAVLRDTSQVQRAYYQEIQDQLRTVYGPNAPPQE